MADTSWVASLPTLKHKDCKCSHFTDEKHTVMVMDVAEALLSSMAINGGLLGMCDVQVVMSGVVACMAVLGQSSTAHSDQDIDSIIDQALVQARAHRDAYRKHEAVIKAQAESGAVN